MSSLKSRMTDTLKQFCHFLKTRFAFKSYFASLFYIYFFQTLYVLNYLLRHPVKLSGVKVSPQSGKVEISLAKLTRGIWQDLGNALDGNGKYVKKRDWDSDFENWRLVERSAVTHDVDHLVFEAPNKFDVRQMSNALFIASILFDCTGLSLSTSRWSSRLTKGRH
jgi:hypothetical protein